MSEIRKVFRRDTQEKVHPCPADEKDATREAGDQDGWKHSKDLSLADGTDYADADDESKGVGSRPAERKMSSKTASTKSINSVSTASTLLSSYSSTDASISTTEMQAAEEGTASRSSFEYRTRAELDAAIQKYRQVYEAGCHSFHQNDIEQALEAKAQLDRLLPLCEEYMHASELQSHILLLKREMKQASLNEKLPLAKRLQELETRYQEELDAQEALSGDPGEVSEIMPQELPRVLKSALELPVSPSKLILEKDTMQRTSETETDLKYCVQYFGGELRSKRRDCLVVLQAAPLVWVDEEGGLHALPPPDFETEKKDLKEAVDEAKMLGYGEVDLVFEEATTKGLGRLLATGRSRVLHFSCHGQPGYLGLENKGAMQALSIDRLRQFIAAGQGQLELVFVSACHSRPAGEAFLAAGVAHVVCCKTEESLRDTAATIFAQSFYTALACGKQLRAAFELARQAVLVSPSVIDSHLEMDKFLLLPETPKGDPYHDVTIFYTTPLEQQVVRLPRTAPCERQNFPPPPEYFIGREVLIYEILRGLQSASLVKVIGPCGIGKSSVVKSVLSYVFHRSRMFSFDRCIWVGPTVHCVEGSVARELQQLYQMLSNDEMDCLESDFKGRCRRVVGSFTDMRALIAFDARELVSESGKKKLGMILNGLALETRHVRMILLCSIGQDVPVSKKCHTECINVPPLDKRSTAMMFGSLCAFVQQRRFPELYSSEKLAELLVPYAHGIESSVFDEQSARGSRIFDLIGAGNPARIREVSTGMTEVDFVELVHLGVCQLEEDIIPHLRRQQEDSSSDNMGALDDAVKDLKRIRDGLPSLAELEQLHGDLVAITSDNELSSKEEAPLQQAHIYPSKCVAFVGETVGVETSGASMDDRSDWNAYVNRHKRKIESLLRKLARHGTLVYGETEISVDRIEGDGMERIVVGLECEIELRNDLETHQYKRVRELCRKIADHLEEAGATKQELDRIMIGAAWKGSIYLLLEAPSNICRTLLPQLLAQGTLSISGFDNMNVISVSPAFAMEGAISSLLDSDALLRNDLQIKSESEVVLWKEGALQMLIPRTDVVMEKLLVGGIRVGSKESETEWACAQSVLPAIRHCAASKSAAQQPTEGDLVGARSIREPCNEDAQPNTPVSQHVADAEAVHLNARPVSSCSLEAQVHAIDIPAIEAQRADDQAIVIAGGQALGPPNSRRKSRRLKSVLLVALVAIAVSVALAIALRTGSGDGSGGETSLTETSSPSASPSTASPSSSPTIRV